MSFETPQKEIPKKPEDIIKEKLERIKEIDIRIEELQVYLRDPDNKEKGSDRKKLERLADEEERLLEEIQKIQESVKELTFADLLMRPSVIVKRSSGEMDKGWKIIDPSKQMLKIGEELVLKMSNEVFVNKNNMYKKVKTKDLLEWNREKPDDLAA